MGDISEGRRRGRKVVELVVGRVNMCMDRDMDMDWVVDMLRVREVIRIGVMARIMATVTVKMTVRDLVVLEMVGCGDCG